MSRPDAPVRPRRFWAVVAVIAIAVGIAGGAALSSWPAAQATSTPTARQPSATTLRPTTSTTTADGPDLLQLDGPAGVAGLPPMTDAAPRTEIDNRVFVLGDSVMQGAAPFLDPLLAHWSITADTKVGRFLEEGVSVLHRRRSSIGDVAVVLMGNNYNGDEAAFAGQLHDAMTELHDVRHVIFLTVTMYQDDRAEVNTEIRRLATEYPNVTVVDWGGWCDEHVDEFLVGDRLHLNPDGAHALASLVAEAVNRVTRAAGEAPKPGRTAPSLNTSGTIPTNGTAPRRRSTRTTTSGSGSGSGSSSRSTTTAVTGTNGGAGDGSPSGSTTDATPTTRTATTAVGTAPPTTAAGA